MSARHARTALALATVAGAAGGIVGLATLSSAETGGDTTPPAGVALLESEIEALTGAGLEEGDPKLEMLQDDLADVQAGVQAQPTAPAPPEAATIPGTGADAAAPGASAPRGGASASRDPGQATSRAAEADLLDDGPVQCEPIPPDLLTVDDLAGATCQSLVQPDGSSLYVATRPDGTEHAVRFAPDGTVTRLR